MKLLGTHTATIKMWGMILLGVLFSLSFVSAVPPVIQASYSGGLEIAYPQYDYVPKDTGFNLRVHVINLTASMTNITTSCFLDLYNHTGEEIMHNFLSYHVVGDFEVPISSNNFSDLGLHSFYIQCNNTNKQIGFVSGKFEVTSTGKEFTIPQSYIYMGGLIFLVLLIFGIAVIINKLPSTDSRDEEGAILHISQLKHLRSVLWVVIWGLALAIMFIISNLALAYLSSSMMGALFFVLYQIMFYATIIGVPIYFIWIFVKIFRDAEFKRMIERGVDIPGP